MKSLLSCSVQGGKQVWKHIRNTKRILTFAKKQQQQQRNNKRALT